MCCVYDADIIVSAMFPVTMIRAAVVILFLTSKIIIIIRVLKYMCLMRSVCSLSLSLVLSVCIVC